MDVFRINKEPGHERPYHADPLSVIGSRRYGGRWNPKGVGVLYTSRTPELALLETLVHLPPVTQTDLPRLWLSTLRLPAIDEAVFWVNANRLPPYWQSGTLAETQTILAEWLNEPFSLAIAVPSVILPISYNLLIHPQHPAFDQVERVNQFHLPLDNRLAKVPAGSGS